MFHLIGDDQVWPVFESSHYRGTADAHTYCCKTISTEAINDLLPVKMLSLPMYHNILGILYQKSIRFSSYAGISRATLRICADCARLNNGECELPDVVSCTCGLTGDGFSASRWISRDLETYLDTFTPEKRPEAAQFGMYHTERHIAYVCAAVLAGYELKFIDSPDFVANDRAGNILMSREMTRMRHVLNMHRHERTYLNVCEFVDDIAALRAAWRDEKCTALARSRDRDALRLTLTLGAGLDAVAAHAVASEFY
jgi:hypothetical protein